MTYEDGDPRDGGGWTGGRSHTGDVTYEEGDARDGGGWTGGRSHTGDVTYEEGDAPDGRRLDVAGAVTPEM